MDWIKTSDKLPEIGQKVLGYDKTVWKQNEPKEVICTYEQEIDHHIDVYGDEVTDVWQGFVDVWGNNIDEEDILYWLPIPELPTI